MAEGPLKRHPLAGAPDPAKSQTLNPGRPLLRVR